KLWLPTLFTVLALSLLVSLGIWQLHRLEWKQTLLAKIDHGFAQPAIELPPVSAAAEELEYRKVHTAGKLLSEKYFFYGVRSYQGQTGYDLVIPVQIKPWDILLVNFGWVPQEWAPPQLPQAL